jgi:hypothetical protein
LAWWEWDTKIQKYSSTDSYDDCSFFGLHVFVSNLGLGITDTKINAATSVSDSIQIVLVKAVRLGRDVAECG